MTTATTTVPADAAYEGDFHAWCEQQAARLRARIRPGANDGIDYENIAEEIESLGRSDRREIRSRLRVLLCHLLKWRHQDGLRGPSWRITIRNQRESIASLLEESPSLVPFARAAVAGMYPRAIGDAGLETLLPANTFPTACPFSEDQVFDLAFLPSDLDATPSV
jgi:Domain of unknown function DUF29